MMFLIKYFILFVILILIKLVQSNLDHSEDDESDQCEFSLCNLNYLRGNHHGPFYTLSFEYSPHLRNIYSKYLKNKTTNIGCTSGSEFNISAADIIEAKSVADTQIQKYKQADQIYTVPTLASPYSTFMYEVGVKGVYNEFVTKNLVKKNCLDKYQTELEFPSIEVNASAEYCDIESDVSLIVKCDVHYPYRRIDGKCNNLVQTNWGSSFHCQRRLLPPDYADGVNVPRVAKDGLRLPNTRVLSTTLMPSLKNVDTERSVLHMTWGQYLAHDTFKTLQFYGFAANCCNDSYNSLNPEECDAITPLPRDQLVDSFNQTCEIFVRSIPCKSCRLGYREQISGATPTIDLSNLYGMDEKGVERVRSFKGGELRFDLALDGSPILPKMELPKDDDLIDLLPCQPAAATPFLGCLYAGDGIRSNQQPYIAALHVVWNRRHNYHARALKKVNPHWDDNKLFEEARKLNIAEHTKINFDEYFPTIFNQRIIDYYQIGLSSHGYSRYNPYADPSIIQSVGVAALRFGHSQAGSNMQIRRKPSYESTAFQLRDKFLEMSIIWNGDTGNLIRGLAQQPAQAVDSFIDTDVHQYLLFRPSHPRMADLAAVNLKRGRDHGVPGYIYYLEYCTGIQIKSWTDLNQVIPEDYVERMSKFYTDFQDIDLFIGGLAERHLEGSLLGPTFGCLLATQVYHWKFGDRFYFEHGHQAGSFTLDQLNNIRNVTNYANVLCKVAGIEEIQEYPLLLPSHHNRIVPCHLYSDLDYELWRE